MQQSGNGYWRAAAVGMASCLITMAGAWFTLGRDIVTRHEVERIVSTQAPYVQDRKLLNQAVTSNSRAIGDMRSSIDAIRTEIAKMDAKLSIIVAQEAIRFDPSER